MEGSVRLAFNGRFLRSGDSNINVSFLRSLLGPFPDRTVPGNNDRDSYVTAQSVDVPVLVHNNSMLGTP